MSKNVKNFIATIVFAFVLSLFLPWWSIMIASLFSAMLVPLKRAAVFFVPFLAILLFWAGYTYVLSSANDFTLAKKISELLMLGGNPYLLILVTGVIGGLAGGMSAVLGKQFRSITSGK
jgi:hypothetical protein